MLKNFNDRTIKEKLEYIGLDLNNVPQFLKEYNQLNYRVSRIENNYQYRIYKFIPINKIQILITPKTRMDTIKEKYLYAKPLYKYLEPIKNEDIEYYAAFLNILKNVKIDDIESTINEQVTLNKKIPFDIKFKGNYSWQIYYSESSDTYFMLITSDEYEYGPLFSLLKMQIEFHNHKNKKLPEIFVPISQIEYSENILTKPEIASLESYLWLFTKEWPMIYEVFDKFGHNTIQIVGELYVYNNIKSIYKIKLSDRNQALDLFKKLKALFILQTELPTYYNFEAKIDKDSNLELYYKSKKINFLNIVEFIKKEYYVIISELNNKSVENDKLKKELENLKISVELLEKEYLEKQKQIVAFLNCKKSFIGKIKYFFRKKVNIRFKDRIKELSDNGIEEKSVDIKNEKKEIYTIEDLVTIYSKLDKLNTEYTNFKGDIKALTVKNENMKKKVKNATLYICEIEKHKKNIFEFWKFACKDEKTAIEAGENDSNFVSGKLRKNFDYSIDMEQFAIQADKIQREKLSKEELDSIFLCSSEIIKAINIIKRQIETNIVTDSDDNMLEKILEKIKDYHYNEGFIELNDIDIFGSISDDTRQIKKLGNKSHREVKKDIGKVLNLTKNMKIPEFKEKLVKFYENIKRAYLKITSMYDISIFYIDDAIDDDFIIGYINCEQALKEQTNKSEICLNKLELKESMPLLYFSNIVFYNNYNETLPFGMNEKQIVLLDKSKFIFNLDRELLVKANQYDEGTQNNPKTLDIKIKEFSLNLK